MRGYPQKELAKKTAYEEETAQRLWKVSMELSGETYALLEE